MPRIDVPGLAALTLGLGAAVLAMIQVEAWSGGAVIALGAVGVLALLAFWRIERRVREPIVEFELFRNGPYFGASAVAFCLVAAYWTVMFFQPQYLQDVRGYARRARHRLRPGLRARSRTAGPGPGCRGRTAPPAGAPSPAPPPFSPLTCVIWGFE
jgi:hypothetical protein